MAAVPVSELSVAETQELLCTYAALILHDEKSEITAEKINKLISGAGAKVEGYLPTLFARLLANVKVDDLINSVGSGSGAAAPAAAAGSAAPAAAAAAAAAPAKKEEDDEPVDFDLFD